MKKVILAAMLLTITGNLQAQIVKEILQQKKTQIEYLVNQIGALKVYIGYLQKGYNIADEGLTLIGNFKDGEFKLHKDYFASLKNVKPSIRNYTRIKDIINLQVLTYNCYLKDYNKAKNSNQFTQPEIDYMQRVYVRVLDDCSNKLDELLAVTTSGKLEMKDAERIERIDYIFSGMQSNYTFTKGFGNAAMIMAKSRQIEINNAATVKDLQTIK
jgi:hypothetical protein